MPRAILCLLTTTVLVAGSALCAQAQDVPPIKPGLWQAQSERKVDGKQAPDVSDRLQNLPPEVRKQVEATMRSKGIAMGPGGVAQICHTRESIDQGRWQGEQGRCKTDMLSRSAKSWKWRSTCKQPDAEIDGEAIFAGPESYTVKTALTMAIKGETRTTHTTIAAKWVGSDCGDLKPVQPSPPVQPPRP